MDGKHQGQPLRETAYGILLFNPSLLGFTLGLIAIIKSARDTPVPSGEDARDAIRTGGKLLAIFGVIASAPGLLLTIVSLSSRDFHNHHRLGRESAAIQTLRTIHNAQAQYQTIHSRFATLEELAASEMLEAEYAGGRSVSGYIYSSSNITTETY
ncbi:MAG TPA: hypothetical protein VG324_01140, partial [Blastocatellia bacterium]|nr:hypothetical protein [Blastocatellia bacterium]